MTAALNKAISLILSGDRELASILLVTAKMSLSSSLIALLFGVPLGIWLGSCRFRGRQALLVFNRTLMGLPPVVMDADARSRPHMAMLVQALIFGIDPMANA